MDDLVVVILTLILIVAGSLGQMKKKKAPVFQPKPEGKIPEIWETLFGEPIEPDQEPAKKPESAPFFEGETAEGDNLPEYQFNSTEEGMFRIFKKDPGIFPSDVEPEQVENNEYDDMDEFSLRKAVIYSEILKPKYF